MNVILLPHKKKGCIVKELNTSYPTVRTALWGVTDTELALKIREKAIQLGGVEVKPENN